MLCYGVISLGKFVVQTYYLVFKKKVLSEFGYLIRIKIETIVHILFFFFDQQGKKNV